MPTNIRFLGHAAFEITVSGSILLVDPFIEGNPKSPLSSEEDITEADIILVTHDHYDHGFEDAIKIAKRTGATIVAVAELVRAFKEDGLKNVIPGNLGGMVSVGYFKITFFPAVHSSNVGSPCGFIVHHPDFSFYHAGDTAFFGDMACLADEKLDLALLPIGSTYTMDINAAAKAVELIRPKTVIPMHYDTFPAIKADPEEFRSLVDDPAKVVILAPGESVSL
ncbi:MAG: metal-dependent hydrolase [Candidatus Moranbacteria bacterium]|nr:metal-dependent hydrolase [Candidatus Moranbacteria bacterium]